MTTSTLAEPRPATTGRGSRYAQHISIPTPSEARDILAQHRRQGKTFKDLAEQLDMTISAVQRIATGKILTPRDATLVKIAALNGEIIHLSEKITCLRPTCTNQPKTGCEGYCYKHARAMGLYHARVDAEPARQRVLQAIDGGLSIKEIARRTKLNDASLVRLRQGKYQTVRKTTYDRLMAFPLGNPDQRQAPTWPSTRRLQALRAAGYTVEELVTALGICNRTVTVISYGQTDVVPIEIAETIHDYYAAHEADPVRPPTPQIARNGWIRPMDWDDIDDPDENPAPGPEDQPDVRYRTITSSVKADVETIYLHNHTWEEAGQFSGVSRNTLRTIYFGTRPQVEKNTLAKITTCAARLRTRTQ